MDESNNPVVKKIPVYLSKSLLNKLVVYQYPLERNVLHMDNSNVVQCHIKENPHEVQLDLELDINSSNYCTSKGEQIAINVDGRNSSSKNIEEVTYPRSIMDKQTLCGTSLTNLNCLVGVLHENELHVTPLNHVNILRPGFKYLDKVDKRIKTEAKETGEGEVSEDEEEMKQVTVKFARQENERTKKTREKSFGYVSKMTAKDVWFRSNYYNKGTDKSELQLHKLYCRKRHDKVESSKHELINLMNNVTKNEEESKTSSSHGQSLSVLRTLPLVDRVKKLLLDAKLLTFGQLKKHLWCSSSDEQDCVRVVQQVGVLVQGCWVLQSDIMFGKDIGWHGIPSSVLRVTRDYILYLFSKSRTVTRKVILDVVKLPGDIVKELLEGMAELNDNREWQFLLPTDVDFIKSHQDLCERHQKKWELKHDKLVVALKNPETNSAAGSSTSSTSGTPSSPTRQRRKSYRDSSISSDNESGAEMIRKNVYQINNKIRRTKKNSVSFSDKVSYSDTGLTNGGS